MADDDGGGSLRERKRLAAMLRVQAVALDMFEERGFDEVTVEEIADASDVSPSSVYRYFGSKEGIVLWDEFDADQDELLALGIADPVPLEGLRRTIVTAVGAMTADGEALVRRRLALVMTTPALEAAATAQVYQTSEVIGRQLASRLGRSESDLEVQVFSHAFTGGLLGMVHHWHGTGFAEPLLAVIERVFEIFEEGLDIVTAPLVVAADAGATARD